MADRNHTDCGRTFRYHGFITRSDPTMKHVEESGRSDWTVIRNTMAVNVECKSGEDGYRMRGVDNKGKEVGWRTNQREWAFNYCMAEPFSTPYWIYLTIGTDTETLQAGKSRPKPVKGKPNIYQPRKTWLIPTTKYLEVEELITPYQETLPYMVRPNMNTEMQSRKLDAVTLLQGYELTWYRSKTLLKPRWFSPVPGEVFNEGIWTIPNGHPFWLETDKQFIKQAALVAKQYTNVNRH